MRATNQTPTTVRTMQTPSGISACARLKSSPFSTQVISVFCASAGTHRCQGDWLPRLKTLTRGSSEVTRMTMVELAWASLKVLQRIATAISTADSAAANGSSTARNSSASRGPYWNIAARVSLRSIHWPGRKLSELSTAISMLTQATATHLPTPAPSARPDSSAAARASRARARPRSCRAPR